MRRQILASLAELRRRVLAGEIAAVACIALGEPGHEGVMFAVGECEGGDDEWCELLDELRAHVLSGDVMPPPDGPGEGGVN